MINPDLKKIFNAASKKNEAFVREAISVFPKVDTEGVLMADLSVNDIRMIQKAKKHGLTTVTEIKETVGAGFNKKKPPTDKEIKGVLKGTITKPTGIFAAKGGKVGKTGKVLKKGRGPHGKTDLELLKEAYPGQFRNESNALAPKRHTKGKADGGKIEKKDKNTQVWETGQRLQRDWKAKKHKGKKWILQPGKREKLPKRTTSGRTKINPKWLEKKYNVELKAKGGRIGRAALGGTEDRPGRHPPVKKEKTRKEKQADYIKKHGKPEGRRKTLAVTDKYKKIRDSLGLKKGGKADKKWIQKATKGMRKDKPCTGKKFGSATCPPGSKRYNLARTFKKMARSKHASGGLVRYI